MRICQEKCYLSVKGFFAYIVFNLSLKLVAFHLLDRQFQHSQIYWSAKKSLFRFEIFVRSVSLFFFSSSLNDAAHVGDLKHTFVVIFHHILLVCMLTTNLWHRLSFNSEARILVEPMSSTHGGFYAVSCGLTMHIGRENFGEGITHFEFPVKCGVKYTAASI